VIVLRDMEGREPEEACTLLGISAENQRVLLHRARGRIRKTIDALVAGPAPAPVAVAASAAPRRGSSSVVERLIAWACGGLFVRAASRPCLSLREAQ
jgi:hypothetical protein